MIEDQKAYAHLERWMSRRGGITILVLSIIPNPLFDLAGIAAGFGNAFLVRCAAG